jgi:hypothetical protein
MFEMTASFTLTPDRPGIPHFDLPHKLQQQHRAFFTDKAPISEDSGRALAEWAAGGSDAPVAPHSPLPQEPGAADDKTAAEWDMELGEAAKQGMAALQAKWSEVPAEHKPMLKAALDRRHKPTANQAEQTA